MTLQDYAPYYIGCPCLNTWFPADHDCYNAGWKLRGFHSTSVKPYRLENDTDFTWRDSVKLVLRRLEDMTEEEALGLAKIYSGADMLERIKGTVANWWYFKCQFLDSDTDETLTISADGHAWYAHYFDNAKGGFRNIIDEYAAAHYLLQKHFDLFGLIPAGLAIDVKTIKQ